MGKLKWYEVPVIFQFEGTFQIKSDSPEQAEEDARKHCCLVLGGNIYSEMSDDYVNWDFATHSEKIVGKAEKSKTMKP